MVREYFEVLDDLNYTNVQLFNLPNGVTFFRRYHSSAEFNLPSEFLERHQFLGYFYFRSSNGSPWRLVSPACGERVLRAHLLQTLGRDPTWEDLFNYDIPQSGPGILEAPESYPYIFGTVVRRSRRQVRRTRRSTDLDSLAD